MSKPCKNNAYIFETDTFRTKIYDADTTIDMFGEDYLEEYGVAIPQELIDRCKALEVEIEAVRDELRKFIK